MQLCISLNIFGIVLLWDWNENWPFPVLWPLLSFPDLLAYWVQHFNNISFRIWNRSAGILSPSLVLLVVMLPEAHLTSHSMLTGSRWVITLSWLSRSLRPFLYSSSVNYLIITSHSSDMHPWGKFSPIIGSDSLKVLLNLVC